MAIDHSNVTKAIVTALTAASSVTDIVSTRIKNRTPQNIVFPWLRFDMVGAPPAEEWLPYNYIWDHTVQFVAFSDARNNAEAADIIKAVSDVMEVPTNLTVTGASVVGTKAGFSTVDYVAEDGTWTGIAVFQIFLQES